MASKPFWTSTELSLLWHQLDVHNGIKTARIGLQKPRESIEEKPSRFVWKFRRFAYVGSRDVEKVEIKQECNGIKTMEPRMRKEVIYKREVKVGENFSNVVGRELEGCQTEWNSKAFKRKRQHVLWTENVLELSITKVIVRTWKDSLANEGKLSQGFKVSNNKTRGLGSFEAT